MSDPTIFCRTAVKEDLNRVVEIHTAAFPGFFLTLLGPSFLRLMYLSFLQNHKGIFIVAGSNQVINGFAVGVMDSAGKDWKLALKWFPQFLLALINPIVRNPLRVLKRLFSQVFSKAEPYRAPKNSAILRSIAILPGSQGGGLSGVLIKNFEANAKKKNADYVALTTDATSNERAISFYKKHGYVIQQIFEQDSTRSMLMLKKKLEVNF